MARKAPKKDAPEDKDAAELLRMGVALLACVARDLKGSADQIQVLDAFGVSSPLIAKALDISPITVRTALHRRRKGKAR